MDPVPEIFLDAVGEISLKHGMIRIELVSLSGPEPRVTHRLITGLQAFTQVVQAHNGMFEQLEKAGLVRPIERTAEHEGTVAETGRQRRPELAPQPAIPSPASEPPALAVEHGPSRSPNFI